MTQYIITYESAIFVGWLGAQKRNEENSQKFIEVMQRKVKK